MRSMRILIFTIFVTLLTFQQVKAAGQTNIGIVPDKQTYKVGDTIIVTIKTTDAADIYGIQFKLVYDEACISFKKGAIKSAVLNTVGSTTAQGKISYAGTKLRNVPGENGDVSLVTLQFDVIKEGSADLNLSDINVSDSNSKVTTISGTSLNISIQNKQEQNASTPAPVAPSPSTSEGATKSKEQPSLQVTKQTTQQSKEKSTGKSESEKSNVEIKNTDIVIPDSTNKASEENNTSAVTEQNTPEHSNKTTRVKTLIIVCIALIILVDVGMIIVVQKRKKKVTLFL